MEPTIDESIHTVVADRVVINKRLQPQLAYMSSDRANWSEFQLTLHEACESSYNTFALLDNAWLISDRTDPSISNMALAAYAAWQGIEVLAKPYFPDL